MSDVRLIGDAIRRGVLVSPNAPAATLGDEQISFRELDEWADRLAAALLGLELGRGSVVAWFTAPALHTLAGLLACARVGAIFAPIPPSMGAAELSAVLSEVEVGLLVCDRERLAVCAELDITRLAVVTNGEDGGAGSFVSVSREVIDLACLEAASDPIAAPTPGLRSGDPHVLYLTSGSTGAPKGVLVSHRASWLRSDPEYDLAQPRFEGMLCSFPIHHYGGLHYVFEAWLRDTAVHLVSRASGPEVVAAIERRRPTAIYCIPAVWERVLATAGDLSSIKFADTGTSAVTDGLLERIESRLPQARTRILYGATEAGRMAALEHAELSTHPGSVGRAPGEGKLRIADDGEVLFSGPTLMTGYYRRPAESEAAIRDGWYHTGDLGRIDSDGYLFLTGRKREMIRTGGEWVAPVKVDAAMAAVPGLRESAAVGIADARWGEIVCVAVVPSGGEPAPTVDELREQLSGLAAHERPRLVVTVAEIPRTGATGQVRRSALKAMIERQQVADKEKSLE